MTATERLRALLDEREVDWEAWNDRITVALPNTHYLEISDGTICAVMVDCTPEQAVEATLGSTDELDEEMMTVLHDRLNAAMHALERSNGDMDARINAVSDAHEVLAAAEEMRRGTCRNVYEKGHFKCSECGHYTQTRMVYRDGKPADPRFCPNCGRRVES